MSIGDKICKFRKELHYSQEYIAEKLGVSRQSVSLWETNQTIPSMEKLIALANILNVSLEDITNIKSKSFRTDETPFANAETSFNQAMIKETVKASLKRFRLNSIIIFGAIIYFFFMALVNEFLQAYLLILILCALAVIIVTRYLLTYRRILNDASKDIELDPNKKILFDFYTSEIHIRVQSNNTNSSVKIAYSDFSKYTETDNYYMLTYINKYYAIDKSSIMGDVSLLKNTLNTLIYSNKKSNTVNVDSSISNRNASKLKSIAIAFFILNFFTLPIVLMIINFFDSMYNTYSSTWFIEHTWMLLFGLPLPLVSLFIGYRLKAYGLKGTKNIVIGYVMTILLVLYGSFSLIFGPMISHDYTYVDNIEAIINFELPDTGQISTQDYYNAQGTRNTLLKYESDVIFTDAAEINQFDNLIISSPYWTQSVSSINVGLLSTTADWQREQFDYFMIYNIDLSTYNEMPSESGVYNIIYLAYNIDTNIMQILEYSIEIS